MIYKWNNIGEMATAGTANKTCYSEGDRQTTKLFGVAISMWAALLTVVAQTSGRCCVCVWWGRFARLARCRQNRYCVSIVLWAVMWDCPFRRRQITSVSAEPVSGDSMRRLASSGQKPEDIKWPISSTSAFGREINIWKWERLHRRELKLLQPSVNNGIQRKWRDKRSIYSIKFLA